MVRLGPVFLLASLWTGISGAWSAEPSAEPPELPPGARTALHRLLEAAARRGPSSAAAARQQFLIAQELSGNDDRQARYVYGVVLARLMQVQDAQLELGLAAEGAGRPYPPAYIAWLQSLLSTRDWVTAANGARRFSQVIETTPGAWTDEDQRLADAQWLGRAVSAAVCLVTTPTDVRRWSEVDAAARKTLSGARLLAYAEGFEAVIVQQEALSRTTEEARKEAAIEQAEQAEAERRMLATTKTQVQSTKDNLKLNAEERKKQFENEAAALAKQLGQFEQQWTIEDQRRQSLERSILLIQQEMYQLQEQYHALGATRSNTGRNTADQTRRQLIDQRLGQRQLQLFNYQTEHTRSLGTLSQINQRAAQIVQQQDVLLTRFQQTTGEVARYDSDLDKWKARLQRQEAKLDEQPDGDTNAVRALERRQQAFVTYVPWDWEAERVRLLTIYGTP